MKVQDMVNFFLHLKDSILNHPFKINLIQNNHNKTFSQNHFQSQQPKNKLKNQLLMIDKYSIKSLLKIVNHIKIVIIMMKMRNQCNNNE